MHKSGLAQYIFFLKFVLINQYSVQYKGNAMSCFASFKELESQMTTKDMKEK